ncbi:MAG: hypothetical protein ACYCW6_18235 [Candidatus Xenobia bacterium]
MSWKTFVVPPPGTLLELPPRAAWAGLMGRATPSARKDVLERARLAEDRPHLLMTGHQPGFWHPGVWIKNFVLEQMADACNALRLHVSVDSDLPPTLSAGFPAPGPERERATLYTPPGGRPFEVLPVPTTAKWDGFVKAMRQRILPELRPRIDRLHEAQQQARQKLSQVGAPHLGIWLDLLRRELEDPPACPEVPLSHVCATASFRGFVAEVLSDLKGFWQIYNDALASYRKMHHVRSAANPMPDLRIRGTARETPFWILDRDNVRRGLWVEPDGTLLAREVPIGRFTGEASSLAGLSLRPRALTLTLFFRSRVCDLFVHGVGGARYDTITDAIAQAWLGTPLPPYACISLSWPLFPAPPAADPRALRRVLRDAHWNPQRWVEDGEKPLLVEAIHHANRSEKRRLAEAIQQVNAHLEARLTDRRAQWQAELEKAETDYAARSILQARDYPYFLYDPQAIRAVAFTTR